MGGIDRKSDTTTSGRNGFQDGFALWKFSADHIIQFFNSHLAHDGPMLVSNWLAEKALSRKS